MVEERNPLLITLAGVIAGFIHVITGPDHLTAVAPLSIGGGSRSWKTGLRWGLGHSGGVVVIGLFSLFLREILPIQLISTWSERLVGVTLIGIGIWGLRRSVQHRVHTHAHTHDGSTHVHIHVHGTDAAHTLDQSPRHLHTHAAFAIGTLHGLAGGSHVIGVLPAVTLGSRWEAITYLASFGIGTLAAMAGFAFTIGIFASRAPAGGTHAWRWLMTSSSVMAMGVGAYWLFT